MTGVPQDATRTLLALNLHPDQAVRDAAVAAALGGLDLGTSGAKAVSLARQGETYSLLGLDLHEQPGGGADLRARMAAQPMYKTLAEEIGFAIREVAVALSGSVSSISLTDQPMIDAADLREVLPFEIEQYLPINPVENVIDCQLIGPSRTDSAKVRVLMGAGQTSAAQAIVALAKHVKTDPRIVDVDELALANMYTFNYGADPAWQDGVCLLNVGHQATSVLIFHHGELQFSRLIKLGGEALTNDIRVKFGLTVEQAEALKREQGRILMQNPVSRAPAKLDKDNKTLHMAEAMQATLKALTVEIKRCLDFYESKFDNGGVKHLLLCGGGSRLRNMDRYLADSLGLPVELANPFKNIWVHPGVPGAKLAVSHAADFGVAVGLALRTAR